MLNKPKYRLFNNAMYAFAGLKDIFQNESSFKLQTVLFVALSLFIWLLHVELHYKAILQVSLFIPLLAEIANSSIERTVDLVTLEYHELAKRAKDAGAALVLVSFFMVALIWGFTLAFAFKLV